jgi:hypothetical protein
MLCTHSIPSKAIRSSNKVSVGIMLILEQLILYLRVVEFLSRSGLVQRVSALYEPRGFRLVGLVSSKGVEQVDFALQTDRLHYSPNQLLQYYRRSCCIRPALLLLPLLSHPLSPARCTMNRSTSSCNQALRQQLQHPKKVLGNSPGLVPAQKES